MVAQSAYEDVRAAIVAEGSDARVEVNQRALIDKVRLLLVRLYRKTNTKHAADLNANFTFATYAECVKKLMS